MKQNRFFSAFQIALLAMPAIFLFYLIRFTIPLPYPLPSNVLEVTTGILFLVWIIGVWKFHFPRPSFSSRWQIFGVGFFLLAATLATAHLVMTMAIGQAVPLGIWKGWFVAPAMYFLMLISSFRTAADLKNLIDVTLGLVSLTAADMLLQFFTGAFSDVVSTTDHRLVWPYLDPVTGTGSSGNYPAIFLAPFLCLGFVSWLRAETRFDKFWYAVCVFMMTLVIYFSKSYGAWLAVIGACGLVSFVLSTGKTRWLTVPLIALLLLTGLYLDQRYSEKFQYALDTNEENVIGSGEERLNIWKVSRDLLEMDPIWGVGPGQFQRAFQQQAPFTIRDEISRQEVNHALHPHNTFLMFWLSNGVLGLVSFVLLILIWVIPLPREWRWVFLTPLFYYLAHGMIDVFYWKNDLAYSFWFFGALMVIAQNLNVVSGKVQHGLKVGRELGFPTANIELKTHLDKPYGVYIVTLKIEKIKRRGLLYYGPRKTKGLHGEIVCEITVFDYEGDLYGKSLKFTIGKYLRGPREFNSPEELRKQIEKDVIIARNLRT